MLTDTKLRSLKPRDKAYKVADRDGLYVEVSTKGAISFRYNYRIHARQETLTFGRYGVGGLTLSEARLMLGEAKKLIAAGKSPAREKAREKARFDEEKTLGDWFEDWVEKHDMADSTRDMRRSTYERELKSIVEKILPHEFTEEDLRRLTDKIVERGAPATAVHVREIVMLTYRWMAERGLKIANPADGVRPSTIAKFKPRTRSLSPAEIGVMYEFLDTVGTGPQFRAACKLLLLTLVRKSELTNAKWSEISFTDALWAIPAKRMKLKRPHLVPLSQQALDLLVALKTFAGGSEYVLPSRYETGRPMSSATLNKVMAVTYTNAQAAGKNLEKFGPHDMRRTASTLLHEAGYNTDWIEKQLAHEEKGTRAVYNRAEYLEQRRGMLQDWADMIDGYVKPSGCPGLAFAA